LSNIELNVVALGDFGQLKTQLAALDAQIKSTNAGLLAMNKSLSAKEITALGNAFHNSMMASGQFTSKMVSLSTAAEHLGQRVAKGKTNWQDYRNALKSVSKETSLYNQLGQRQVAMQQAIIQNLGNGMARVYAQHKVDLSDSATRTKVFTEALVAQNATLKQGATQVINWGKNMQWSGRQLTAGLTMPITMASAAIAKLYYDVDKNLTNMAKVYGVGVKQASDAQISTIRGQVMGLAKDLGKQLGISASEVTDTAAQLAAAGLEGKQLLESTAQASRMVVLGETDKQEAIKATIALQTAYKLNTDGLTEAVNFFNAAQAATSTSMADLIEAVPRVGPVIRGLGGSYKDMVAIMTALKEGGVPAGEAANAIKTSMGRLINPTEKTSATLKQFGIDIKSIVTDNAGNLVGMLTTLQQELDKLPSLKRQQAIAELFGKFQFARMAALMDNFNKTGTQSAKVIEMMGLSAADLAGIADAQTKKIQQSASGRFKIAMETFKNTLLPIGESALNIFTDLIQTITHFADTLANLPGPVKSFLKVFGGITLLAGPVVMITGLMGNLLGTFMKIGANMTSLFMGIITKGVNPLKVLKESFRLQTEEEVAAANAEEIFGEQMNRTIGPIEAVTMAIREQISALEALAVAAASNPVLASNMASNLGSTKIGLMHEGTKAFKGIVRSHYVPSAQIKSNADLQLFGPNAGTSKGSRTTLQTNISNVGVAGLQRYRTEINSAVGDKMTVVFSGYEKEAQTQRQIVAIETQRLLAASGTHVTLEEVHAALENQYKTEQQMIAVESQKKAARIAMANTESDLGKTIKERQTLAEIELKAASKITNIHDRIAREVEITDRLQKEINLILSSDAEYLSLKSNLEKELTAALATSVTLEEKQAATREVLAKWAEDEIPELQNLKKATGAGAEAIGRLQQIMIIASDVASGLPIAIEDLVTAVEETAAKVKSGTFASLSSSQQALMNSMIRSQLSGVLPVQQYQNLYKALATVTEEEINATQKIVTMKNAEGNTIVQLINAEDMLIGEISIETAEYRAHHPGQETLANRYPEGKINMFGRPVSQAGVMGIGMGASMAGGFMMASENRGVATAGQSLMAGGMAASILPMMLGAGSALLGPLVAVAAAAPLVVAGFKHIQKEAQIAAAGLRSSMGVTKSELEALGVTIPDITASIPDFNAKTDEATTAVERFKKAIDEAADTSEMKAFVDKLKEAGTDQKKIDDLVRQKATAMALAGVKKEDVQAAITAYLEKAGVTRTNFDVGSLYGTNGKVNPSAGTQAVTGALEVTGLNAGDKYVKPAVSSSGDLSHQVQNTADAMTASFQSLVSTNTDLQTFLDTVQQLSNEDFSNTTVGGETLNRTLQNIVKDKPQLASLLDQLKDKTPAEKLLYLRAAVEGLGGSLENLPKMTTVEVQVLLNQKSISSGIGTATSSATSALAKRLEKKTTSSSTGGGGGGGNSIEDKKIKALQKQIDLIKKQEDERKKALELQKKELDFEKSKLALQNDLRDALASGNLLKAAELRQQISQQEAQRNAEVSGTAKEDAAQAKIDALQKQIDALQAKKSSGGGGGSSSSDSKGSTITEDKLTKAIQDKNKAVLDSITINKEQVQSYDAFMKNPAISGKKGYVQWLKDQGYNTKDIKGITQDLWNTMKTMPSEEMATKTEAYKTQVDALRKSLAAGKIDPSQYRDSLAALKSTLTAEINQWKLTANLKISPTMDSKHNTVLLKTGDGKVKLMLAADKLGFATGGFVSGPGTTSSDSIPAMLSNGEYVLNAAAVAKYGVPMIESINKMAFAGGGYVVPSAAKMAEGGMVSTNNSSINAVFNISGADAQEVADQAIKKLELMMKKNGAMVRI
jgi:TP901 family phage tail tape measure protein